ncbi:hypothetical protein F-E9_499 [Faustovirus]|nr:hypothetical protein F-VV57_0478 [Faustovirus]QJX73746.1 hypothetical protein F-VV63_0480 [Faustovirus]QJX74252.1 hypothetical protein F-E9_499 [Faustovirus]
MSANITPYADAAMETNMRLMELTALMSSLSVEVRNTNRLVADLAAGASSRDSDDDDGDMPGEARGARQDPWLDRNLRPHARSSHFQSKTKNDFRKLCIDDPEFFETFYVPEVGGRHTEINNDTFKLVIDEMFDHIKANNIGQYKNIIARLVCQNPIAASKYEDIELVMPNKARLGALL